MAYKTRNRRSLTSNVIPSFIFKVGWLVGFSHNLLTTWLAVLLSITSCVVFAGGENKGYQLGRGYKVGDTGIHLGGYAIAQTRGVGSSPWSFNVDDLSLFLTWDNGSRLRFFSETEVENLLSAGEHRDLTTGMAKFQLERLYLDYLVNESLTVRLGKILTPVGQWNLIHADPLVWTTTRPVATDNLFSEHATGIMLHGMIPLAGRSLDYSVYGDYSSALDPSHTESIHFDNAIGARLRYALTNKLLIGASFVDFALQDSRNTRNQLMGFDFAWSYQHFAVNSEIVYRNNDSSVSRNNLWQGYVQGVAPLTNHFYGVSRYEFFDQAKDQFGQVGVFGFAYRPKPPLIWKLEYRLGEHNRHLAPDGLYASFSLLF